MFASAAREAINKFPSKQIQPIIFLLFSKVAAVSYVHCNDWFTTLDQQASEDCLPELENSKNKNKNKTTIRLSFKPQFVHTKKCQDYFPKRKQRP